MSFTSKFNELIDKSGMNQKEIAQKCNSYGVNITSSYVSALKRGASNVRPTKEVSRALAKVLNAPSEDTLIIEDYIDKAPEIIKKYFENTKKYVAPYIMDYFLENELTTDEYAEISKSINISDLIIANANTNVEQIKKNIKGTKIIAKGENNIKTTTEINDDTPKGLVIDDDGMSPTINKGDKVKLEVKEEKEYKLSDILCLGVKQKNKKITICRNCIINNNEIVAMPLNKKCNVETYKKYDVVILGKVKVVSKIL